MNQTPQEIGTNNKPPRKILVTILIGLFLLIALSLTAAPSIVSTSWGQKKFLKMINAYIPGKLEMDSLSLNWLGGQEAKGIVLKDLNNEPVLSIHSLKADSSLLRIVVPYFRKLQGQVEGLQAKVVQDEKGFTNLQKALGISLPTMKAPPYTILVEDVNGIIAVSKDAPLSIQLSGQTQYNNQKGSFAVDALMKGFNLENIEKLDVEIKNLPIPLVDQFLTIKYPEYSNLLTTALGETLDVVLKQEKVEDIALASLSFTSSQLNGALTASMEDNHFTLTNPAKVTFTIKPELIKKLGNNTLFLEKPSIVTLTLDQLNFPLQDLSQAEIKANFHVNPTEFKPKDTLLSRFIVEVEKLKHEKATKMTLQADGSHNGSPLTLSMDADLNPHDNFSATIYMDPLHFEKIPGIGALTLQGNSLHINGTLSDLWKGLSSMQLSGKLLVDKFLIDEVAELSSLTILWDIDALSNQILLDLNATREEQSIKGKISLSEWLTDNKPDFTKTKMEGSFTSKDFPVALLQAITGQKALVPLLGETIEINADVKKDNKAPGFVNVYLKGDNWQGNLSLAIDESLYLQRPTTFTYKLTPHRYKEFQKASMGTQDSPIALQADSLMTLTLQKLNIPYKNDLPWLDSSFEAELLIDQIKIAEKTQNTLAEFANVRGTIKSEKLSQNLAFAISVKHKNVKDMSINGTLLHPFTPQGAFNKHNGSLSIQAKGQEMPAGLLCDFACLDNSTRRKLEATLGKEIDATLDLKLEQRRGYINAQAQGSLGSASLSGQVNEGFLTLNKPFILEVKATPELSENVLSEFIPLLGGMLNSDNPLKLTISPDNFSLPLFPLDIKQGSIGSVSVELGSVQFDPQRELGRVMQVLKTNSTDLLNVWFTPIYLSVQEGVLTIYRFDMLAMQRFPIATWGQVDFQKDYIDMSIGLSGKSLQQLVKFPLPDKHYMMVLPFRGPTGKARLDTTKVAARIASLTAQVAGGPHGLVLGTVLGLATGAYTSDKAPEPTTNPLPWAEAAEPQEATVETESDDTQKEKKSKKNPLKAASSLLENFLR